MTKKRTIKHTMLLLATVTGFISCGKNSTIETKDVVKNIKLSNNLSYPIVDTGQSKSYNNSKAISKPTSTDSFYGQDSNYDAYQASYQDNGDGTVNDLVTGLMWISDPGDKISFNNAKKRAEELNYAGYDDWRLPTIKELYSLILFSGEDISGGKNIKFSKPFIDTDYFKFTYGNENSGERAIDCQYWSATQYVSTTMRNSETVFGVNFADGRIKGYPKNIRQKDKKMYAIYVRGNKEYGVNKFVDNQNGTISDTATGLMWSQDDSMQAMNWEDALLFAENSNLAGFTDWRLPNAKELQSIVDYSKSPKTSNSASIDDIFNTSSIVDEGGNKNYPFFWTGTTHVNNGRNPGGYAIYVTFGEALGYMRPGGNRQMNSKKSFNNNSNYTLMDVHGAGAQRSDPKSGDASNYPNGHGPQGDVIRINNYVRLVRDI